MQDWAAQIFMWFGIAEHAVARGLHAMGQDNEMLTLGIVVLGIFLALALVWTVILGFFQALLRLFGFGGGDRKSPEGSGSDLRDIRFDAPVLTRDEPGRLDVVPMAGPAPRKSRKRAAAASEAMIKTAEPSEPARSDARSDARLAQAAGGAVPIRPNPKSALAGVRRVKMRSLPDPAPLGSVVSARPEWTGKVVPTSLEEAGAVEVCKVLSRRAMPGSTAPVRAVDYRICGLPRVDGQGLRQPDVLVYTVADRGFVPQAPAKGVKRAG